jgi:hypothetical protein
MSEPKSKFPTVGKSAAHPTVAKPEKGTLVSKKNTQAGDPTIKDAAHRSAVKEKAGAAYGVKVKFQKQVAPEAGATQGNGKVVPAATNRTRANFKAGESDLNR